MRTALVTVPAHVLESIAANSAAINLTLSEMNARMAALEAKQETWTSPEDLAKIGKKIEGNTTRLKSLTKPPKTPTGD